ncbi:MAG: phosphate acyltransferase PlsX [Armatimonadetes bacterium]|nr:phosphate acyltransferase PlsX [Armatimonadota bacterium]
MRRRACRGASVVGLGSSATLYSLSTFQPRCDCIALTPKEAEAITTTDLPTLAIDAMGGDHAPQEPVGGALRVAAEGVARVLLVGDEARLRPLVAQPSPAVEIVHAPDVVGMDEAPSDALNRRDSTSMGVGARLVKEGRAQALLSAGNTGALMAISLFTIGRLQGIRRPAIAVLWPTRKAPVLVLDSGANADSKPEYLVQFATMGSLYMQHAVQRSSPRVGLLNIGGEAGKGNALVNAVFPILEKSGLNFVGNVEPTGMLAGSVDVAVADGFVGNIALKTGEAVAEMMLALLKAGVEAGGARAKLGALLLKPVLKGLKSQIDQSDYGGAPLLGLHGLVIKAHGRANAHAVFNAAKVAVLGVKSGVVQRIAESIKATKEGAQ